MRWAVFAMVLVGCGGQGDDAMLREAADGTGFVQYVVTAPYQVSGTSPAGNDGLVYSVLPAAPIAADPWQLLFCYQSACLTMQEPIENIPTGEVNIPFQYNLTLTASGGLSCSSWSGTSRVSWYAAAPLYWHIGINATCSDGSFSVHGDWQRVN